MLNENINVVSAVLEKSKISRLLKSSTIEYIEEDALRFPLAEYIPYGIKQVQATGALANNATASGIKIPMI